ncbi:MAG: PorT family protein [Rhodothermaceae bacterium]|nr:PorT family protein [Rhodothermaceae bacterium]MYG45456.1 PorT family protein [Rhodothermaceae bacterium]MYK63825.1 PorT family protein [Rhodothermaceae bacterium]
MGLTYERQFICLFEAGWARSWDLVGCRRGSLWRLNYLTYFGDFAGYYSDYEFPDISSTTDFRINYLSVPALLQFNPISKVRLLAGPVLSFALGCNLESILEADGEEERESVDCGDDIELETVDVSIRAGAGVDIPVSSAFSVSLDAVYDLGMRNYDKEGDDSKNRGFAITAGVSFPLGR